MLKKTYACSLEVFEDDSIVCLVNTYCTKKGNLQFQTFSHQDMYILNNKIKKIKDKIDKAPVVILNKSNNVQFF